MKDSAGSVGERIDEENYRAENIMKKSTGAEKGRVL